MRRCLPLVALAVALAVGSAGCSFSQPVPTKRVYHLAAERVGAPSEPCAATLKMRRVRVAPPFERRGLVVQTETGGFTPLPFDEFAAPPGIEFRGVLLAWLRAAGLFETVFDPGEGRSDWVLEADLDWLYAGGGASHVSVRFAVSDSSTFETLRLLRYVESSATTRDKPAEFVRGWNAAITAVFEQLERDLRIFLQDQGRCTERAAAP